MQRFPNPYSHWACRAGCMRSCAKFFLLRGGLVRSSSVPNMLSGTLFVCVYAIRADLRAGLYVMYTHMMKQRRKVFEAGRPKVKQS